MGRPALPGEVQRLFWSRIRDGEILDDAARLVGVSKSVALRWFREAGGVMPDAAPLVAISTVRLSFAEREEISCRSAAGEGVRAIARVLGRSPSTIRTLGEPPPATASRAKRRTPDPIPTHSASHAALATDPALS